MGQDWRRAVLIGAGMAFIAACVTRVDAAAPVAPGWDAAGAARYLDARLDWWRHWPKAQRDHDTMCISCHTVLPQVLARPSLRASLGETRRSAMELAMFDDVTKRVWMWREVDPFYSDQKQGIPKSSESHSVESILNALFLVTRDNERGAFGTDTRQAFAQMWALQIQNGDLKGGFPWLNFHLEPWESPSATYWGATLAALAVARAPASYSADPAVAPQVEALRGYLRTGLAGQSLYTRTLVLVADSALHGIAEPAQRDAIVADLVAAQGADGGWSLPALAPWQRLDKTPLPAGSDGYATAISALALRESATPAGAAPLARAKHWLIAHQDKATGSIPATSINKDRQQGTDAYLFMTDHATGIAAMVLRPVS
jgi:squalene-hopene/tetraprenyl-beta-curcumene cyclase